MKITVIGATGGTGRLVVEQALARGYSVSAFVRQPRNLPEHPHLHVIQGNLADTAALAQAMAGSDAVLCCLGVHEKKSVRIMQEQLPNILAAMRTCGCTRLVLLSAFGVGDSYAVANWLIKPIYQTLVKDVYADKAEAEKLLPASGLQWTKIYPVIQNNKPLNSQTETHRLHNVRKVNGFSQVPRANVAQTMLDCIRDQTTYGETLVLAAAGAVQKK